MMIFKHTFLTALITITASFNLHAIDVKQLAEKARSQLQGKVPGGAVSVIHKENKETILFGRLGKNDSSPVNTSSVFRIASLSKAFTGELAALLIAENKIAWDSLVKTDVDELQLNPPARMQLLTFKHLLSHQTGVVPYAFDQQLEQGVSLKTILAQMPKAPVLCQPGACYAYQNSLFSVAGLMLERRTGQAFRSLLHDRLFAPLGMHRTSVGFAGDKPVNFAWPHIQADRKWQQVPHSQSYYAAEPAAGINSSIDDLTTWLSAQLGNRADVLPTAIIDVVTQPLVRGNKLIHSTQWRRLLTEEHYGLGWRVLLAGDEQIIFHSGGVRGFSAQISFSRKHQIGLVVLSNAERNLDPVAVDFWCDVLSISRGKAFCKIDGDA
jgi:beta-lactamase class C